MKTVLNRICFFTLLSIVVGSASAQTACATEEFEKKCTEKISKLGFTFLKSYKIDGETSNKTKIEYQYIFTQGSNYAIAIASKDEENKGLILNLYDSNRKLVASNFNSENKKYLAGISYACNTTGIYYLSFSFDGAKDKCAASVLGFKK
jgi:hypothetical protein